jgi:hypothetical protein
MKMKTKVVIQIKPLNLQNIVLKSHKKEMRNEINS